MPAARPALRRAADAEGRRLGRHPRRRRAPRQHDEGPPRLPGLPLLRRLRPGLRHRVVLLLGGPPAAVRAEDGQARDPLERGGGAGARGRPGPRQGRAVLRPQDRRRARGAGQGGGDGRELRGLHPHPAELEVGALPERHRQRLRRDRPLSLRADPLQREGLPARRSTTRPPATTAASAASTSTCRASTTGPSASATTCAASAAVLEHRLQPTGRGQSPRRPAGFGASLEARDQAALPRLVRDAPVRRGAALRPQPRSRWTRRRPTGTACPS